MTTPTPDRFRVGDVWRSPRSLDWQCDRVESGLARLRSMRNPRNTQWRDVRAIGKDQLTEWERITPQRTP